MANRTKYLKFRGKASYAMVYKADDYNDTRFWKINLHPSKEVLEEIKSAGIQNKLKPDDGRIPNVFGPHMTFKRPTEREFDGEMTYFTPPTIYDKDGKKLVWYVDEDGDQVQQYKRGDRPDRKGEPIIIGNGSEVEITLEVYKTNRFGNGSRLQSVKIIDLIEYKPEEKETEEVEPEEKPVEKVEQKSKKKTDW